MPRFFITKKNFDGNYARITGDELHHVRKVLRLRPGDPVTLFDDAGWEHEGEIRSLSATEGEVEIRNSHQARRESPVEITLAVGLTKGDKMDFVVEKATELGVKTIVPFLSDYTVPKLDPGKSEKRAGRWRKIALSAAKQCGRTHVPKILELMDFAELMKQPGPDALKLLFWEKESQQTLNDIAEAQFAARALFLVVGPEGGFSGAEAARAVAHGFKPIRFGSRILRAETAALAALSVAQYLWGDLK